VIDLANKRIVHISCASGKGGTATILLPLLEALNKKSKVELITFAETPIARIAREKGIKVKTFLMKGKFEIAPVRGLINYLKENKADLIHSHDYKSNLIAFIASRFVRVPIVTTVHALTIFAGRITNAFDSLKLKLYAFLDLFIIRFFDRLIAISENTRGFLIKVGVRSEKVQTIYNGIDLDKYKKIDFEKIANIKNQYGIKAGDRVLGIMARLVDLKGHRYIIQAMPGILEAEPRVKLLIVGEGVLEKELKELVEKFNLEEKVIFVGYKADVENYYHILDVFVYPVIVEAFGLALVEAMACGIPIVASNVFAIPEVIEEDKTGILVPPKDSFALAKATIYLLKNKEAAEKMGARGKDRAVRCFLIKNNIQENIDFYAGILSKIN